MSVLPWISTKTNIIEQPHQIGKVNDSPGFDHSSVVRRRRSAGARVCVPRGRRHGMKTEGPKTDVAEAPKREESRAHSSAYLSRHPQPPQSIGISRPRPCFGIRRPPKPTWRLLRWWPGGTLLLCDAARHRPNLEWVRCHDWRRSVSGAKRRAASRCPCGGRMSSRPIRLHRFSCWS